MSPHVEIATDQARMLTRGDVMPMPCVSHVCREEPISSLQPAWTWLVFRTGAVAKKGPGWDYAVTTATSWCPGVLTATSWDLPRGPRVQTPASWNPPCCPGVFFLLLPYSFFFLLSSFFMHLPCGTVVSWGPQLCTPALLTAASWDFRAVRWYGRQHPEIPLAAWEY